MICLMFCFDDLMMFTKFSTQRTNACDIQTQNKGAITKVEKSVGWTFDRDFCYCKELLNAKTC